MTKRTFEALRDCASKMKGAAPEEAKIKEMFAFLSKVDRLARICHDEGAAGLRLEVDSFPEDTDYERAFKESILIRMQGDSVDKASDHAADRYFVNEKKSMPISCAREIFLTIRLICSTMIFVEI